MTLQWVKYTSIINIQRYETTWLIKPKINLFLEMTKLILDGPLQFFPSIDQRSKKVTTRAHYLTYRDPAGKYIKILFSMACHNDFF